MQDQKKKPKSKTQLDIKTILFHKQGMYELRFKTYTQTKN